MKQRNRKTTDINNLDLDIDELKALKRANISSIVNSMRKAIIDEER